MSDVQAPQGEAAREFVIDREQEPGSLTVDPSTLAPEGLRLFCLNGHRLTPENPYTTGATGRLIFRIWPEVGGPNILGIGSNDGAPLTDVDLQGVELAHLESRETLVLPTVDMPEGMVDGVIESYKNPVQAVRSPYDRLKLDLAKGEQVVAVDRGVPLKEGEFIDRDMVCVEADPADAIKEIRPFTLKADVLAVDLARGL